LRARMATETVRGSQRPDCLAGRVRFELRNVAANYPFEGPYRFARIQPRFGDRDYSRLSCGIEEMPLGPCAAGIFSKLMRRCWPPSGIAVRHDFVRDFCRSRDAPPAAKPATPLLTLRWTLSAKRACVVITDTEPDRLAPLAPPALMGLRGVWVVAARFGASTIERSVVCPSANLRGPVRHGLHPKCVRRRPAAGSPTITKREPIRASLRRHWARPCHLPQARAHDGWRRDRDQRAGQRLGVHGTAAGDTMIEAADNFD